MAANSVTPARLAVRLSVYFGVLLVTLASLLKYSDWASSVIPLGGFTVELPGANEEALPQSGQGWPTRLEAALVLIAGLVGTIVLMIPITWVYMATKLHEGYRKAFVEALIVLPICATSIVLLIQDSLALAFGLAALVAAVRFRVRLRDALDGIYVFAAICVGLASGVGFLGVGIVMTVFFCYASVVLWGMNYGANPIEEARQAHKLAKLAPAQPHERGDDAPHALVPAEPHKLEAAEPRGLEHPPRGSL